jgi:hypothetical protein
MARTVAQIQQQILDNIAADSTLNAQLTSTSKRALYRLFSFVVAASIAIHEQLVDAFTASVEAVAAAAAPATAAWLQAQVFKFQYSATTPQTVNLDTTTLAPAYPTTDTTLRIVTQCSVKTDITGVVRVKVAKASPPVALSAGELSALQSYVNTIGVAGVSYLAISQNSDKLMVAADIYYNGQYSAIISTNVISAINTFLAALPFDGTLYVSDLQAAIKAVEGVKDVVLQNVVARDDSTALASGTYLVQGADVLIRQRATISGYIVGETTAGSTFANTLNFVAA